MEKLTENSENLKSDKVWHDGKLISKEEKRKKEIRDHIKGPFVILFFLAVMLAIFGKAANPLALIIISGAGAIVIYGALKEENKFIKIWWLLWGVIFSIPAAANVLAFFGF
ncbi:hypothetical protein Suden_1480 [Sulfurimonas denitrificans DSM 1251]|uniref:Transmembrane protein n=1 Tax=Sulfurimonas denitrificans (strain ATCC 33889 / DSM 1251) TaxID=326298 RepID=Q30QH4_SULDN|nr:hypothetical protein [Sulfurimonas denitrificans]ABB44757.1 hypothetical protein Suden_1480 [Sulfurimonas denitrificans DSM 1251]